MADINHRGRIIHGILYALLILIIIGETSVIVVQQQVTSQLDAQSAKNLKLFLSKPQHYANEGRTTAVRMHNVTYCWSKEICIDTDNLSANIFPLSGGNTVDFDNVNNMIVDVHQANVSISPRTLQGMFNESVFNYPGSKLRNLTVAIVSGGKDHHVKLSGSLNYFIWIPFEMDTHLYVDKKNNTLDIAVNDLHVFGFLPLTFILKYHPFHLEKLLTLPKNKHLDVKGNLMMVKPFGLFPPPRLDGKMGEIVVESKVLKLTFEGTEPASVKSAIQPAKNYIVLAGGNTQFGRLGMRDSHLQVIDADAGNLFRFSLRNYYGLLPQSRLQMQKDGSIVVTMPDAHIK